MEVFSRGHPKELDKWWVKFTRECHKLMVRYPNLRAERVRSGPDAGGWVIEGPYFGVSLFKELAVEGARKLGFKGTPEILVQEFLNHLHGDHLIKKEPRQRRDDERVAIVTKSDGTREGYRGRQRIG